MLNTFTISFNSSSLMTLWERMRAWLHTGTETSVTDFGDTRIELTAVAIFMLASTQCPVRYLVMDCLDFAAENKKNYCSLFGAGEQFVQSLHLWVYTWRKKDDGKITAGVKDTVLKLQVKTEPPDRSLVLGFIFLQKIIGGDYTAKTLRNRWRAQESTYILDIHTQADTCIKIISCIIFLLSVRLM